MEEILKILKEMLSVKGNMMKIRIIVVILLVTIVSTNEMEKLLLHLKLVPILSWFLDDVILMIFSSFFIAVTVIAHIQLVSECREGNKTIQEYTNNFDALKVEDLFSVYKKMEEIYILSLRSSILAYVSIIIYFLLNENMNYNTFIFAFLGSIPLWGIIVFMRKPLKRLSEILEKLKEEINQPPH